MVRKNQKTGFTLIEVLISLTIIGVLALMVFTSLRIGGRAWEKGEREIDSIQQERVLLTLIQEQLASTSTKPLSIRKNEPFYMVGNPMRISFLSTRALIPTAVEGPVSVTYLVEIDEETGRQSLSVREKSVLLTENEDADSGEEEEEDNGFQPMIGGLQQISFEYLAQSESINDTEWGSEWNGSKNKAFPRAVRVRFYHSDFEYAGIVSILAAGES